MRCAYPAYGLETGIAFTLARLPVALDLENLRKPEIAERVAALNDRFTRLQDQLAGALRFARPCVGHVAAQRFCEFALIHR